MSVTLHVMLPSSRAVSVDVMGGDEIAAVKGMIAEASGLEVGTFSLSFEGEELVDEKQVREYPFQDGSLLEVVLCWKHSALLKLQEIEARGSMNGTPFQEAARDGYLEVVRYLVEVKGIGERFQNSALLLAAQAGQSHIVRYLVGVGADVSGCNKMHGRTALHYAAMGGHLDMVRYLVDVAGAEVSAKSDILIERNTGVTPLHDACGRGRMDVMKYLFEEARAEVQKGGRHSTCETVLHAASCQRPEVVRYIVEKMKVHVDSVDRLGRTTLHLAVSRDGAAVRYLVQDAGASVFMLDRKQRYSAYDIAPPVHRRFLRAHSFLLVIPPMVREGASCCTLCFAAVQVMLVGLPTVRSLTTPNGTLVAISVLIGLSFAVWTWCLKTWPVLYFWNAMHVAGYILFSVSRSLYERRCLIETLMFPFLS